MIKRFWFPVLAFLCLLLASTDSPAQAVNPQDDSFAFSESGAMPAWTVPVLRLVSATHVEPTTGIVLSADGLVLVPESFASAGDEIIVLDGGTDLIRNGRPARLEKSFPTLGLKVLRVRGLQRAGAPFADTAPANGEQLQLTAYPPAELIAEGQPPLKIPATIVVYGENNRPSLSGETPLPNVTGPLLDHCGNMAGISIAEGIQAMEPSTSTLYQWRKALLALLRELQIDPVTTACSESDLDPEPEVPVVAEIPVETEQAPVAQPEPEAEQEEEPAVEQTTEQAQDEIEENTLDLEILPPYEETGEDDEALNEPPVPTPQEPASRGWWWLLAAAVLFALGYLIHRLRRRESLSSQSREAQDADQPVPPIEAEEEPGWEAAALDSHLTIRGSLADGTMFEAGCDISSNAINLVIGRGEADLRIDSAAVSRQHARLNGTARSLTLTDLGSNNGTSINGIPCLEEEIMYLEPGDTVILGDARFSIHIETPVGEVTGQ